MGKSVEVLIKDYERIDDLQLKGLRIIQDPKRFCFGIDAVLLSDYVKVKKGGRVLDLCTGTGIIPILLSAKSEASNISAIEIQKESVEMARRSVLLNDLQDKIDIFEGDFNEYSNFIPRSSVDVVTCNPPYMIGGHGLTNDADYKTMARHEISCTLEDVIRVSAEVLKPAGELFMIHRPFRLSEIMCKLTEYGLEPKRMRLVHPYADKEPNMVLIMAKRGAKPRLTVEKPLIVYSKPGVYTEEILEKYGKTGC